MKKFKIILVIIGIVTLALGIMFMVIAFKNHSFGGSTITNTHNIEETFDSLSFNLSTADLKLELAEDNKCTVTCVEKEKDTHTVKVENNTLVVVNERTYAWYEHLFDFSKLSVTVSLPKSEYKNIKVDSSTSNIDILGISFKNVDLSGSTGDVKFDKIEMDDFKLDISTGNLSLTNSIINNNIIVDGSTGNVTITDTKAKDITIDVSTGDVKLTNVLASSKIKVNTSTGDITLSSVDAETLSLTASTGDITGSLKTGKRFKAKASTGEVSVPNTDGGECVIETSTGDITITVLA